MIRFSFLLLALLFFSTSLSAQYTVSGRFFYTDRPYDEDGFLNTEPKPVRFADVEIFDPNTFTTLGEGSTDETGLFEITINDSQARTVRAVVYTDTANSPVFIHRVIDQISSSSSQIPPIGDGTVFSYITSSSFSADGSTDVTLNDEVMPASIESSPGEAVTNIDWSSQVFNIFDTAVLSQEYVKSITGNDLTIPYRIAFNPTSGRTASFYRDSVKIVFIEDSDGYDDSNIIHEIGHYVENVLGQNKSPGGSHQIGDDDQDLRLSWSEGYATFFSAAVLRSHGASRPDIYSDLDGFSISNSSGFSYSIEPSTAGGAANELVISAVLYDLIDDENTDDSSVGVDDDLLSNFDDRVFTILSTMKDRELLFTKYEDFWDIWFELGFGFQDEMIAINSIQEINFFPDDQEPNDSPNQATQLEIDDAYQKNTFYRSGLSIGGDFDEDWFAFSTEANTSYKISINGDANTIFSRPNPEMWLIDRSSGAVIAFQDDPYDETLSGSSTSSDMKETVPSIPFYSNETIDYLLYVKHSSSLINIDGRYGTYEIKVETIDTPPLPTINAIAAQEFLRGQTYPVLLRGTEIPFGSSITIDQTGLDVVSQTWYGPQIMGFQVSVSQSVNIGNYPVTLTTPDGQIVVSSGDHLLTVSNSAEPPIAITEIELGSDAVEIKNLGTVPANLTSWQLSSYYTSSNNTGVFTFPSYQLGPGDTVVISELNGINTQTNLFDQMENGNLDWNWLNFSSTGDINLLDEAGNHVDYVRFVEGYITNHDAPLDEGIWAQPEILSPPSGFTLSRAERNSLYRTSWGLSNTLPTMEIGQRIRDNATDAYEDNDIDKRARLINNDSTISDLFISPRPIGSPDDEDWFSVFVKQGTEQQITLNTSENIDMEVYQAGPIKNAPISSSIILSSNSISFAPSTDAIYQVRVFSENSSTGEYSLSLVSTISPFSDNWLFK